MTTHPRHNTRHPPEDFVPANTYRTHQLPPDVRETVNRKVEILAEALRRSGSLPESYSTREERLLNEFTKAQGRWWTSGSERTVISLGRTVGGRFIAGPGRSVVVKLCPGIRGSDRSYGSPAGSGNLAELQTWKYVVDHRYDDHFTTVLDYATDGSWIAAEEVLPFHRHGSPSGSAPPDYLSAHETEIDYAQELQTTLDRLDSGINIHLKDGNVGIKYTDDGLRKPVVIDSGAHTDIEDLEWTPDY